MQVQFSPPHLGMFCFDRPISREALPTEQLHKFRVNAWFRFGNRGLDSEGAGIYGSQRRDEFDRDDVEQVTFKRCWHAVFVD